MNEEIIWISISKKNVFVAHSTEPIYNKLHDRWDSVNKITLANLKELLPPRTSDTPVAYEINGFSNLEKLFKIIDTKEGIN